MERDGDVMKRVELNNVSVAYRHFESASRSLKFDLLKSSWGKNQSKKALSEIDLVLEEGQVLGIIGRNGAGKSTLAKAILGSIVPTIGWVRTEGVLTAMIELGSGLNMDLSAFDNVRLHSALYGITEDADVRCERVCEWAGLKDNVDDPLRTFSSGMMARFAFSLNTDLKPDILIIDEILSVGDIIFQEKSFERTRRLMSDGCTVLLISHDLSLIRSVSTKVLWLEQGKIIALGEPDAVCDSYINANS